jgi:hypothetical protein
MMSMAGALLAPWPAETTLARIFSLPTVQAESKVSGKESKVVTTSRQHPPPQRPVTEFIPFVAFSPYEFMELQDDGYGDYESALKVSSPSTWSTERPVDCEGHVVILLPGFEATFTRSLYGGGLTRPLYECRSRFRPSAGDVLPLETDLRNVLGLPWTPPDSRD